MLGPNLDQLHVGQVLYLLLYIYSTLNFLMMMFVILFFSFASSCILPFESSKRSMVLELDPQ